MTTIKVNTTEETQKEFESRLKYVHKNEKLSNRRERVVELRKMYEPHGYKIPVKLLSQLIKAKIIYK